MRSSCGRYSSRRGRLPTSWLSEIDKRMRTAVRRGETTLICCCRKKRCWLDEGWRFISKNALFCIKNEGTIVSWLPVSNVLRRGYPLFTLHSQERAYESKPPGASENLLLPVSFSHEVDRRVRNFCVCCVFFGAQLPVVVRELWIVATYIPSLR